MQQTPLLLLSFLSIVSCYFTINGSQLLYNGDPFVARGINLQYGDHPHKAFASIQEIAKTASNIIRLQLRSFTKVSEIELALTEIRRLGMKVMIMLWDERVLCRNSIEDLQNSTSFFLSRDVLDIVNKFSDIVLLNPANEFSDGFSSSSGKILTPQEFGIAYGEIIARIRCFGYKVPIVIDGFHCGQLHLPLIEAALHLYNFDPLKQVILSLHAYGDQWKDKNAIDKALQDIGASGYPFIVGEHGVVEFDYFYKKTLEAGIGVIAWSFYGNGPEAEFLNMNQGYAPLSLTEFGKAIVEGQYGIRNTSKRHLAK
jgi:mannan endo-1,4-beta-mannosidase